MMNGKCQRRGGREGGREGGAMKLRQLRILHRVEKQEAKAERMIEETGNKGNK
jgi:hypothetical protein